MSCSADSQTTGVVRYGLHETRQLAALPLCLCRASDCMTARLTELPHRECVVYGTRLEDFADPWVESSRPVRSVRIDTCFHERFCRRGEIHRCPGLLEIPDCGCERKGSCGVRCSGNCVNRLTQCHAICRVPCIRCCANAKERGAMDASHAAEASQAA